MSKKLPKYKLDSLNYLFKWANKRFNIVYFSDLGFNTIVYSEEHSSLTFYHPNPNFPEIEVDLSGNKEGVVVVSGNQKTTKYINTAKLSSNELASLCTSISHVLLKVPFTRLSKLEQQRRVGYTSSNIERSVGFHYNTSRGILSVIGSYQSQYMYPSVNK